MMLVSCERYGIYIYRGRDFKGDLKYRVHYGLQSDDRDTLDEALTQFNNCMKHAVEADGL